MEIKRVSLRDYTSLRIGGGADLVVVTSQGEMIEALRYAKREGKRVHILGGGTNSYFNEHIENLFVIKNEIKGIEARSMVNGQWLMVGAGEVWDDVVVYAVEHGLWGVENLSYIPGSVGAAPVQNIGAYGSELKDVFVSLTAIDTETLETVEVTNEMCQFGYRDSLFKHSPGRYVICSVTLSLSVTPKPVLTYKPLDTLAGADDITLHKIRDVVIATRKAKLPDWVQHPNAGSFFKNPIVSKVVLDSVVAKFQDVPFHEVDGGYKVPAAWLIEHIAKMKGVRMDEVGTWPSQPLVIVNFGQAHAVDVNDLAHEIIEKVKENTGIVLEKEVNFIA